MDHCDGLTDLGAATMALALRGTLRELDWSYCRPGVGAVRRPLLGRATGPTLADGGDDPNGIGTTESTSVSASSCLSLPIVAAEMRGLRALYLIGHRHVDDDAALSGLAPALLRRAVAAPATDTSASPTDNKGAVRGGSLVVALREIDLSGTSLSQRGVRGLRAALGTVGTKVLFEGDD